MKNLEETKGLIRPHPRLFALAALILCAALLLSSCSLIPQQDDRPQADEGLPFLIRPQNDKYLREDEWVRMITLAITHADQRGRIWESIPASQRAEISQSDFYRYVSILAECLPGTLSSFQEATQEEADLFRGYAARLDKQLTPKSTDAAIWWIKAKTSDLRELKFAVPVTCDKAGIPFFSKTWISRQVQLYEYVILYLDALTSGSKSALFGLLSSMQELRSDLQEEALRGRTDALLTYYRNNVNLTRASFRCLELMPGRAVFEEQLLPSENGTVRTRSVVFTENEGLFRAEEKIPQVLDPRDMTFYLKGEPFIDSDQTPALIESDTAIRLAGIPLSLAIVDRTEDGRDVFQAAWPGLTVEAWGTCDPDNLTFEGQIHQISASYSFYSTGSGLTPGDSVHALYLRYPFARENGYLISSRQNGVTGTLAVQVESDHIARITLSFDH